MAISEAELAGPRRPSRRRAETRRRVIEAAYDVFAELGIRDAPVELICERAGFTRGAFYSNFASKEELFLALYEIRMRERAQRLREAVEQTVRTADRDSPGVVDRVLRDVGMLFMESLTADVTWYLLNLEFRAQALRQPELRAPTAAAERRFHDALTDILQTMLDRLDLRLGLDPRNAIVTIVALYETTLERAILDDRPGHVDTSYLTEVLPRLFTSMIATDHR
ncbi:TetR/AcrR family transcriptional regulator [Amycolatopsis jiangsuensis]|uniref:AcrR family transcriptional regulator n=1 Tax=Amycolatopsis jiangsuensis TaxID=1181879 RepID=A0A840J4Q1_9PSEU|nr:TetR/AcrR family transcriptional regulator [Amycolatopsis jiangsuensis]MBB4688402.1 AcrR family transcriptional regulator [Amycolatopsis jiangsuensis]